MTPGSSAAIIANHSPMDFPRARLPACLEHARQHPQGLHSAALACVAAWLRVPALVAIAYKALHNTG